ncbi:deoxyribonuclease-1-like isoform X2 [Acropora millepora]|uniref:deoxyribonuclease-1-like isoform X2 n=1 Tax=Acropora millepora TaxID=45264 RepID=UPI001CF4EBF5|nr:deoxyribonuclease-1-like isoform X2 [Acropora millepora]
MQIILTTCKLMLCLFCFHIFSFNYLDAAKVHTSHGKEHGLTWKKPQDRFLFSKRDACGLQHQNFNTEFSLKLAAFNVRIFGARKMATAGVPAILVKIILRYDVILIQEIRDSSGRQIKKLLELVNKASTRGLYRISISPRLGRSSSKEQYAFFYRKDVLSVSDSYVYDDGDESLGIDTFEREPYIVRFQSSFTDIKDFILVAIHTSPINAPQEIDELVSVYDDVVTKFNIPDVIILGDLNAACSYFSYMDQKKNRLMTNKRFHWLITDCVDTSVTGSHCAYDRFVVAGNSMLKTIMESSARSFKFDEILGLNKTVALKVSDHYPIEVHLYSRKTALITKTVEFTFRTRTPQTIDKKVIFRLKKNFGNFNVTTIYNDRGSIHGVTFSQNVADRKEALKAILDIKRKAYPAKVVSLEEISLAEDKIKGEWGIIKDGYSSGVKMVCEIYPSPTCWIAFVAQY